MRSFLLYFVVGITTVYTCYHDDLYEIHILLSKRGLNHLSPLHGAVDIESDLIKNYIVYDQTNLTTIARTLFRYISGTLQTTTHNPYRNFTAASIAILVHGIDCGLIDQPDRNNILDKLKKSFKGNKNNSRLKRLLELLADVGKQPLLPPGSAIRLLTAFLYKHALNVKTYGKEIISLYNPLETMYIDIFEVGINFRDYCQKKCASSQRPALVEWSTNIGAVTCDSTQTALHAFFNELLFDPDKKKFAISRLPVPIQKKMPSALKNFYIAFSDAENFFVINRKEVKRAWVAVMSSVTDIQYCPEHGDILPTYDNMICAFSYMLGTKLPTISLESALQEFSSIISDNNQYFDLRLQSIEHDIYANQTDIAFLFTEKIFQKEPYLLSIHLKEPEHAWFSRSQVINYEKYAYLKYAPIEKSKDINVLLKLEGLLRDQYKPGDHDMITSIVLYAPFLQVPQHVILQELVLYACPADSDHQKFRILSKAISLATKSKNARLFAYIQRLLQTVKNIYYIGNIAEKLVRANIFSIPIWQHFIESQVMYFDGMAKQKILIALLEQQAWQLPAYKKLIMQLLPMIEESERSEVALVQKHCFLQDNKIWLFSRLKNQDIDDTDISRSIDQLIDNLSDQRKEKCLRVAQTIKHALAYYNGQYA